MPPSCCVHPDTAAAAATDAALSRAAPQRISAEADEAGEEEEEAGEEGEEGEEERGAERGVAPQESVASAGHRGFCGPHAEYAMAEAAMAEAAEAAMAEAARAEAARAKMAMAEAARADVANVEARTARAARAAVRQAAEAAVEAAVEAAAEARKQAAQSAADAAAAREQAARSAAEAAAAGKKARGCKKAEQAARGASSGGARSDDVAARHATTPPARYPPVSRRAATQQRCRSGHPLLPPRPPLAVLQPPPSPSLPLAALHPASLQQAASLVGLASAAARAACDRYRPACCEPSAVALPVAAAIAHSGPDLSRRSLAEIDLSDFEHRSLRDSVTGDLRPSVRHRLRAQSREGESCIV